MKADEDAYAALVAAAKKANKLIEAVNAADAIVLADYDAADGALKAAYEAYFAFIALNTYTDSENVTLVLSDVISNPAGYTEATDIVNNQARLLECMKKYVVLKFPDAVSAQGEMIITAAYQKALSVTSKGTHAVFRASLLDEKNTRLAEFLSSVDYKYVLNDVIVEETLDNVLEILQANLDATRAIANDKADAFIAFYNANKSTTMPNFSDIGTF